MTTQAVGTRQVVEVRQARPAMDGDGVKIARISGMRHAGMDPVLLLDELRSEDRADFGGGFPPHPHRGMQTLTYMRRGGIVHEDSEGNRGEIRGGGVQWMSAGSGIIHSEMPTPDSEGFHGFQLWVNLPAARKMEAPRYRDIAAQELASVAGEAYALTAIAGRWQAGGDSVEGPLAELADLAAVADLDLARAAGVDIAASAGESVMAYVYDGSLQVEGSTIASGHMLVTGAGDSWHLQAGTEGARVLLLRGTPLREPVANYGPFVMNTAEEIEIAIREYQDGEFVKTGSEA